jgi:hypothetical protein
LSVPPETDESKVCVPIVIEARFAGNIVTVNGALVTHAIWDSPFFVGAELSVTLHVSFQSPSPGEVKATVGVFPPIAVPFLPHTYV